jgi:hypothetical protein
MLEADASSATVRAKTQDDSFHPGAPHAIDGSGNGKRALLQQSQVWKSALPCTHPLTSVDRNRVADRDSPPC